MKKFAFLMVCMMAMLFVSNNTYAQDKKTPFLGTWVLTSDTPIGQTEMKMIVEENDGKITGYLTAEALGQDKIDMDNINTEKDDEISFSFYTPMAGMDIEMYLTLDGDQDTAKGAMMGQFPVDAKRDKQ